MPLLIAECRLQRAPVEEEQRGLETRMHVSAHDGRPAAPPRLTAPSTRHYQSHPRERGPAARQTTCPCPYLPAPVDIFTTSLPAADCSILPVLSYIFDLHFR